MLSGANGTKTQIDGTVLEVTRDLLCQRGWLVMEYNGQVIVLVWRGGDPRVFSAICPHLGGPLEKATIDDDVDTVRCPWHGYLFSLHDGSCLTTPGRPWRRGDLRWRVHKEWLAHEPGQCNRYLRFYPVEVCGSMVRVRVDA